MELSGNQGKHQNFDPSFLDNLYILTIFIGIMKKKIEKIEKKLKIEKIEKKKLKKKIEKKCKWMEKEKNKQFLRPRSKVAIKKYYFKNVRQPELICFVQ